MTITTSSRAFVPVSGMMMHAQNCSPLKGLSPQTWEERAQLFDLVLDPGSHLAQPTLSLDRVLEVIPGHFGSGVRRHGVASCPEEAGEDSICCHLVREIEWVDMHFLESCNEKADSKFPVF
jgi:hypothetical protein